MSSVKILTATLSVIMAIGACPRPALAQTSFTAEKVCGLADAPRGFKKIQVFVQRQQYYRPMFDVYEGDDKRALMVSNISGQCWLRIDMNISAKSIQEISVPFGGDTILMNLRSRKMAKASYMEKSEECYEEDIIYISKLYYKRLFPKDFPANDNQFGENICFQAIGFGSYSILMKLEGSRSIVIDIIAGVVFLGETN